jgi:hypothetical protein
MLQDILLKVVSHSACQTTACFLYGTRRFITVFTKLEPNPVHPIGPNLPKIHLNVLLPPKPRSSQWSLLFGLPHKNPVNTSPLAHAYYISRPPDPPWFNHNNDIRWRTQAMKFIIMHISSWSVFLLGPNILNTVLHGKVSNNKNDYTKKSIVCKTLQRNMVTYTTVNCYTWKEQKKTDNFLKSKQNTIKH